MRPLVIRKMCDPRGRPPPTHSTRCAPPGARLVRAERARRCPVYRVSSSRLQASGEPQSTHTSQRAWEYRWRVKITGLNVRAHRRTRTRAGATDRETQRSHGNAERERRHTAKRECEVLSSALKHLARGRRRRRRRLTRGGSASSAPGVYTLVRVGARITVWARIGVRARVGVRVRVGAKVRVGVRVRVWVG